MSEQRSSVLEGIIGKFNDASSSLLKNKLSGGLWTGEVPEGKLMPYAQMEVTGSDFEWTMSTAYIEQSMVNIHFYAASSELIKDCMNLFEDLYNWQSLVFPDYDGITDTISIELMHRSLKSDFVRDANGNLVYFGTLSYLIKLFRVE